MDYVCLSIYVFFDIHFYHLFANVCSLHYTSYITVLKAQTKELLPPSAFLTLPPRREREARRRNERQE